MTLIRVTAPAAIVTLAEAKAHLRVDHTDDDATITALVAVATAWIDGAGGWLGRALGSQQWDLKSDGWNGRGGCLGWSPRAGCWYLPLPLPPLISVDAITYTDTAGATQTWATANYVVAGVGSSFGGHVTLADGASWPVVQTGPETFKVRFTAGYAAGQVPAPIRHAILLMVGHLYANREEVVSAQSRSERLPMGADALLAPYRVFS